MVRLVLYITAAGTMQVYMGGAKQYSKQPICP